MRTGNRAVVEVKCRHCGAEGLEPMIGKYGPYGRCRSCGKNTKFHPECPNCGARMRFERADAGFAGECGRCAQHTTMTLRIP